MKKRKVLHVLNSNRFSGAERVVIEIITSLPEIEGYYVSRKGTIEETLRKNNISYYLVDRLTVKTLSDIVKRIEPDIIHAHDFTASMCAALCILRKPIISHLHNNVPWMKVIGLRSTAYLITTFRYKKIIVVSKAVEKEFVYRRAVKEKTTVISNPINIKRIQKSAGEKCGNRKWDLIFVGRLSEQKNLPLLIDILEELAERLGDYTIAIVGEGEKESYFSKEIQKRNLEKDVSIMGFLDNPYPLMKNAKLLLLPSKWEGFGLVAIEALALGTPVVCSGVGGLNDIVDDTCGKKCGFDVMAYVDEIERLLKNEEYYNKKVEGALARAKNLENFECFIEHIRGIYDEI